jgi:inosine triphosphate pyrophosphatase
MDKKIINFVTGNKNKANELQQILNNTIAIKAYKMDLPEFQGEPDYIAAEKCRLAALEIDEPVLVEDTSLCFNALEGLPGPYIKWFLDKIGLDGLNKLLLGYEDKSAYAQTIFAYTEGKDKPIYIYNGYINGKIVPARGNLGFGWDAVFQPNCNNEYEQTFGEMDESKKNSISHRYLALQKFKKHFNDLL